MIELTEWFLGSGLAPKPWLVLGKGPTFARRHDLDLTGFHLLSLNHVVAEVAVDVAHVIDLEVVEACADALESNCRWLLIPRYPSIGTRPGTVPLEDHFATHPVLRRLDESGRLVWYNVARTPAHGDGPVIGVKYFSAEAAIEILARSGVRTIRSLGVDGGRAYASEFDAANLLVNGQPAFDTAVPPDRGGVPGVGRRLRPVGAAAPHLHRDRSHADRRAPRPRALDPRSTPASRPRSCRCSTSRSRSPATLPCTRGCRSRSRGS